MALLLIFLSLDSGQNPSISFASIMHAALLLSVRREGADQQQGLQLLPQFWQPYQEASRKLSYGHRCRDARQRCSRFNTVPHFNVRQNATTKVGHDTVRSREHTHATCGAPPTVGLPLDVHGFLVGQVKFSRNAEPHQPGFVGTVVSDFHSLEAEPGDKNAGIASDLGDGFILFRPRRELPRQEEITIRTSVTASPTDMNHLPPSSRSGEQLFREMVVAMRIEGGRLVVHEGYAILFSEPFGYASRRSPIYNYSSDFIKGTSHTTGRMVEVPHPESWLDLRMRGDILQELGLDQDHLTQAVAAHLEDMQEVPQGDLGAQHLEDVPGVAEEPQGDHGAPPFDEFPGMQAVPQAAAGLGIIDAMDYAGMAEEHQGDLGVPLFADLPDIAVGLQGDPETPPWMPLDILDTWFPGVENPGVPADFLGDAMDLDLDSLDWS